MAYRKSSATELQLHTGTGQTIDLTPKVGFSVVNLGANEPEPTVAKLFGWAIFSSETGFIGECRQGPSAEQVDIPSPASTTRV